MSSGPEHGKSISSDEVAAKVCAIVAAKTDNRVTPESTIDSLGLDSLAMAEIIYEIETAFGIRADERLLDLRSLGEVVAYIDQRLKQRDAAR